MACLTRQKASVLYLKACKERGYKKNTTRTAMENLKPFFAFLDAKGIQDLRNVKREHIVDFLEESELSYAENTRRAMLISIRRLFTVLYEKQKIIRVPTEKISFKAITPSPKEILSEDQMEYFLSSIDVSARQGLRDKALFELMYSSALRSREASSLLVSDLNLESSQVLIREPKNRQDRLLPITDIAAEAIESYLPIDVMASRPLFLSDQGGALGPQAINKRFIKWAKAAGLYRERLTVHSIRHSCARHLLAHGAHLRYVQELLGHKSVESTELYTMENDENLKRIYKQYHPRENSLYEEVNAEYLKDVDKLIGEIDFFLSRHGR